jgi:hypothetical protein
VYKKKKSFKDKEHDHLALLNVPIFLENAICEQQDRIEKIEAYRMKELRFD